MRFFMRAVIIVYVVLFGLGLYFQPKAHAQTLARNPYHEYRYCGELKRGSLGEILRDKEVIAAFKRIHPCPSTGKTNGACDGWAIDHVIPLACGGCDAVTNMQWLPDSMKNHAGILPKDRWERQVYAPSNMSLPACQFRVVKP